MMSGCRPAARSSCSRPPPTRSRAADGLSNNCLEERHRGALLFCRAILWPGGPCRRVGTFHPAIGCGLLSRVSCPHPRPPKRDAPRAGLRPLLPLRSPLEFGGEGSSVRPLSSQIPHAPKFLTGTMPSVAALCSALMYLPDLSHPNSVRAGWDPSFRARAASSISISAGPQP
jgi:hypothetical protein